MSDKISPAGGNAASFLQKNFVVDGIGVVCDTPVGMIRLREPVIFPYGLTSIQLEDEENLAALDAAMKQDRLLAVFNEMPQKKEFAHLPFTSIISQFEDEGISRASTGTLVRIVKEIHLPDTSRRIVVRGIKRVICSSLLRDVSGAPMVRYRALIDPDDEDSNKENLARQKSLSLIFQEFLSLQPGIPEDLQIAALTAPSPSRCSDVISDTMNFSYAEKLLLLTTPGIGKRLEMLTILMNRELETLRIGMKIQSDVQEALGESQREYYLREQLKTIKKELGELSANADVTSLTEKMNSLTLPEAVTATVKKELERLELIPQNAPEYHISYNYISWLLDIPWCISTPDRLDCEAAGKILEEDHFGLEEVKSRILEFLAVMQLRAGEKESRAPILCLVGPPGVGKTSLGRSIARAMNRKFIRVSLGGVRDEAEIRGHRRTYVGALPGRIVQNLKRVGSINPVFMLDEVDKLAHDFRGDPASALLEVLDPEQNNSFNDNFVELPLDLSKVFFIATANVLEDIPGPLRDRMEVIQVPGYTAFEKREIAKRYLVKRQIAENGLSGQKVRIPVASIDEIIDGYTMEAGVRTLDRTIAQLCRKAARKILSGEFTADQPLSLGKEQVHNLLGARKFLPEKNPVPRIGSATGMAWTSVGGVILPVETLAIPGGKGELKLTGSLGKVMQESAAAAFTLLRTKAEEFGIEADYFTQHDFHIHVPDGATPKDGPSAGVTISLALASLLRQKPLVPRLAMTGEITLQGRVTAIGGVREKLTGALRAGVDKILMPVENRKDYEELPGTIKEKLSVVFVSEIEEALKYGFGKTSFPPKGNTGK